MKKEMIAILLSTYNGERYLKEQIDSIINQDYKNWELYIRDDGSIDSTTDIIENYCQKYNNIFFLKDNYNKGAAQSFLYLLENIESEYYMFCDQDDVWFNDKITSVYTIIKDNEGKNTPVVVFSDAKIVDKDLKIIDNSFWHYNKILPQLIISQPDYISVFNCAPGCTMIFNNALKKCLIDYDDNILMHDWYIMIKALQYGIVRYEKRALMMYRQHHNNVIGAMEISIKNRLMKIGDIKKSFRKQRETFDFVNKYLKITFFKYVLLKFKFNLLRFKKIN